MISYIKRLSLVLQIFFCITTVYAQDVHYYKLIKEKVNGTISTNVSGGQFITFRGDVCYESNKNGVGVDHGTMQRNDNYSNSQFLVYQHKSGSGCYWGKDVTFKFTSDKSKLNVVLENGDVYLYERAIAPAGQETCSLIREKSGGGEIVIPSTPIYVDPYNPTPTPTSTPTPDPNTPTPVLQRQQHKCGLCGGSGRVIETNGISFGNTKWCSECGKTVPDYHYHTVCPSCKGKGWW